MSREGKVEERSSKLPAWSYLVWLSWQRQARARQMVWIALGLLVITATIVGLITAAGRWGPTAAVRFSRFSRSIVFEVLFGFLLPIWCLSFATQALGAEREERSLVWLLTRPLSRPAIYLAKFVALLPWSLGLAVGGFGVLCLVAAEPGALAFRLYWPAVALGTLAYCSLFHLMGAYFRRPSVVAILYTFFLETFVGSMPGHMKRVSISFYTRCIMLAEAGEGRLPSSQTPAIFLPVDSATAWQVLLAVTISLLIIGTAIFARKEYHDLT